MCKPVLSYVLVQWLMTIEALAKYGDNDLLTISNFESSILEMANGKFFIILFIFTSSMGNDQTCNCYVLV